MCTSARCATRSTARSGSLRWRPSVVPGPNLVEQILTPDGRLRAAPPRAAAVPLLTSTEGAAAAKQPLRIDRAAVTGLTGPARILATPTGDGTQILVVAASLAGRDR